MTHDEYIEKRDEEAWLPYTVSPYEGEYEISSLGKVRRNGKQLALVNMSSHTNCYKLVSLYRNGVQKHHSVHRLVAQTFIPNPDTLPQVNHKNGIKDDNRVDNLEWCGPKQNMSHAFDTGLAYVSYGASKSRQGMTEEDVADIRMFAAAGISNENIAHLYPIKKRTVGDIVAFRTWRTSNHGK